MIVARKLYASNVELTVGIFKSWFRSRIRPGETTEPTAADRQLAGILHHL